MGPKVVACISPCFITSSKTPVTRAGRVRGLRGEGDMLENCAVNSGNHRHRAGVLHLNLSSHTGAFTHVHVRPTPVSLFKDGLYVIPVRKNVLSPLVDPKLTAAS